MSIDDFEAGNIDPDRFDHEAHVYMGWLFIREFGAAAAIVRFDAALKRLLALLGAEGKYHATMTWFFLLLIAERHRDGDDWLQFKQQNSDLVANSKCTLSRYYSKEFLFSTTARERFVLPDRLAAG
tara:strand:+ start:6465 stop:6842 length:378 start_codon:yes stop_codon:yes gene_type:complete